MTHGRHGKARTGRHWITGLAVTIVLAGTVPAFAVVTVRPGDTLWSLAQRYLGNGNRWPQLYAANRAVVGPDPNLIYAGEQLALPGKLVPHRSSVPAAVSPVTGTGCAYIARFLENNGYSRAGAAGIAGDIWGESLCNPESVGSGGGGIIGWTPLPPGLVTGNPAADLQSQLAAILAYNRVNDNGHLASVRNAVDSVTASRLYSLYFERPASLYSDVYPSVTLSIYAQL